MSQDVLISGCPVLISGCPDFGVPTFRLYFFLTLIRFLTPLELKLAVLPARGEPKGASERTDHVLPGPRLRKHPEGGLEGPA